VTPPWAYEGVVALGDGELENWNPGEHWIPGPRGAVLANGDVLLVRSDGLSAVLRDSRSGAWRSVPGLPAYRHGFGFIALADGSALAVGGVNADGVSFSSVYGFDPATTSWRRVGALKWARSYPGVALLPDGRVLVAGGSFLNGERADASTALPVNYREGSSGGVELADIEVPMPVTVPYATVEIFDPATGTSTMARPMACARGGPGVAMLADGRIMFTDLVEPGCGAAEIYDPGTGSFTKTGELPPFDTKALALLGVDSRPDGYFYFYSESLGGPFAMGDGGALLGLGQDEKHGASFHRSFRFRPATNSWVQFGPMAAITLEDNCTRSYSLRAATLVPLADGRVFVVGGSIPCDKERGWWWWDPVLSTRIFDPITNTWSTLAEMPAPMDEPLGLRLADGSVLLVGQLGERSSDTPRVAIRYVFDSSN
jgi:hypothetical protein